MHRLLLLPLSLILIACPGDDGTAESGDSEDGGATSTGTSSATGSEGTTGSPQTSEGSGTTTSDTTPGDSTSGGGGDDPGAACTASCEFLMGCGIVDVPTCGIPCAGIASDVAGCEAEYVTQQECVVALTCEQAQQWFEGMMFGGDYPCGPEDMAYQACLGGGSGG